MKTLANETCTLREHKATAVLTETDHGYRHALVLKMETILAPKPVMFEVEHYTAEGDTCQGILNTLAVEMMDKMKCISKRAHRQDTLGVSHFAWEDLLKACDTAIHAAVGAMLATL